MEQKTYTEKKVKTYTERQVFRYALWFAALAFFAGFFIGLGI